MANDAMVHLRLPLELLKRIELKAAQQKRSVGEEIRARLVFTEKLGVDVKYIAIVSEEGLRQHGYIW